jgi:hypothetical protein
MKTARHARHAMQDKQEAGGRRGEGQSAASGEPGASPDEKVVAVNGFKRLLFFLLFF